MRLLLLLAIPLFANSQVKVAGEMRKIMQQGDLSASMNLDTMRYSDQLYGLGVAEGLKGEIIILAGKPYITEVEAGTLKTRSTADLKPAMFVFQSVSSWTSVNMEKPVLNLPALEDAIGALMKLKRKHVDEAFAFLIRTNRAKANYHVIDWQPGEVHTMSNHKQFAKFGELEGGDITILGFYSNHHQGIFTHHDSNIHLHVVTSDRKLVGHIDDLAINGQFELLFPGED